MARKSIQEYIESLIAIFYGLSIASGIEYAAPTIIKAPSILYSYLFYLFILALTIAISDWILYHVVVTDHPYRGLFRLFIDMLIPVLIFFLFQSFDKASGPDLFGFILVFYFILSTLYLWLLTKEVNFTDKKLLSCSIWSLIGSAIFFLSAKNKIIDKLSLSIFGFIVIAVPWAVCNLKLIRHRLLEERDKKIRKL